MRKILLALFFGILAFDFRGQTQGGGLFQHLVVASTLSIGLILCASSLSMCQGLSRAQRRSVVGFLCLLGVSALVFVKNGVPFDQYIRVIVPVVLAAFAFIGVSVESTSRDGLRFCFNIIVAAAIASAVWKAFYAFAMLGVNLDTVRYEILSQGTGVALAIAIFFVVFPARRTWLWALIGTGAAGVIVMSVTRNQILAAAAVGLFLVICIFKYRKHIGSNPLIRFISVSGAIMAVGLILVPLVAHFRPDVWMHWGNRLFGISEEATAMDTTMAMRIAQIRGQYADMLENPIDLFFGRGFGKSFFIDTGFFLEYGTTGDLREESKHALTGQVWQNADTTYFPILYSGGLFYVFVFFGIVINALTSIRAFGRLYLDTSLFNVYGPLLCACVFMLVAGIFGNFLLDRLGAPLFMAICACLMNLSRGEAAPAARPRNRQFYQMSEIQTQGKA